MPIDYQFCKNNEELYNNVLRFYAATDLQRNVLGNPPVYFVHVRLGNKDLFSLSKFTAFQNMTVEGYVLGDRGKADGGKTQRHISWITQKKWCPFDKISDSLKISFINWIHAIFPKYNIYNARFITIEKENKWIGLKKIKKSMSPEQLRDKLRLQIKMGEVGERIVYFYEVERLAKLGAKDSAKNIDHVALYNTSAGYDIVSAYLQDKRCIEVKASFSATSSFYLTANEYETLADLGKEAYLYRVIIYGLEKGTGKVLQIVQDPIRTLEGKVEIKRVLYKVSLQ
jgi:hypothetical protein